MFFANAQQHIAILVPAVAKSCPNTKKQSKKTLHSNHHHRFAYASIKNEGSYLNIMLLWYFFPTLIGDYANAKKSHNNIMLSIQCHSLHPEKISQPHNANADIFRGSEAVFFSQPHPPIEPQHPTTHFSGAVKK
ncbi:MAG: hypothetical protein BGO09_12105 [Bacteroidetes bacterium 47-18]|nr:MAG: hypothetical protein BGO09_12105 [Bacteroidetes bacterium 47-18]